MIVKKKTQGCLSTDNRMYDVHSDTDKKNSSKALSLRVNTHLDLIYLC